MKAQTLVLAILGVLFLGFVLLQASPAVAQSPLDDFPFLSPLTTIYPPLPYQDYMETYLAPLAEGEPDPGCGIEAVANTAWFEYMPATDTLIDAWVDGYSAVLAIYTYSGSPSLDQVACAGGYYGGHILATLNGGVTYYIQVGSYLNDLGQFSFVLQEQPPPPPLGVAFNLPGDIAPNQYVELSGPVWNIAGSLVSGVIDFGDGTSGDVYVYDYGWGEGYFYSSGKSYAEEGDYTVRVDLMSQDGRTASAEATIRVRMPALAIEFYGTEEISPNQTAEFGGYVSNTAYATGSGTIDFGDGSTGELEIYDYGWEWSFHAFHVYTAEGEYPVTVTLTSSDGRTVSAQRTIRVRNHDVAIASINAPQSARVGQTRTIVISLKNYYHDEMVRVQLIKNDEWDPIGHSTLLVPVYNGNRTTNVELNYTFTQADADEGKVTFRAEAYLDGYGDMNPADNIAISTPPTRVSGSQAKGGKAEAADLEGDTFLYLPTLQSAD